MQVTAVFTAFALGTVVTLLLWGMLADRVGERAVIAVGLSLGAIMMAAVAASDGYEAFLGGTALAGALGSSAIAASGRAVFSWFPRDERGLALGLRQTAVPAGAALASLTLPPLAAAVGLDAALYVLAGAMLAAAVACGIWLREGPRRESAAAACSRRRSATPHLAPERGLVADDHRPGGSHLTAGALSVRRARLVGRDRGAGAGERCRWAPPLLGSPPVAGRTSVTSGSSPSAASPPPPGVLLLAAAALVPAPAAIAVPVLMAGGVAAMSWNGLSFTAAAEISGRRQAGHGDGHPEHRHARGGRGGAGRAWARWPPVSRGRSHSP